MYLEKLEIQGFKSFANKNTLVFPGMIGNDRRGITSVVGPNGSGKSNIADAIRWVLGEQSMKTLRGKKSEDIIFSGSDKKGKLGMAEVSLFLNNEDKKTPIDYSLIVLTRRLYRDGASEYLLNNSRVRLSDVQMLLAKAKFGQKTYSVIGQGIVEGFLNTSLAERKEFFDEATGVKQFQIKRDESLNKLRLSHENLDQVEMLLTEIEPRLKSLTRQVNRLQKRELMEGELKELQLNYYGKVWHEINDKFNESNKLFLSVEKTKIEKDKKLSGLNQKLGQMEINDQSGKEFNEWQGQLSLLQNKKDSITQQIAKLEAQLEIKLESSGHFDLSWLNSKKNELTKELERISYEQEELASAMKSKKQKAEEALAEQSALNKKIKELNERISGFSSSVDDTKIQKLKNHVKALLLKLEKSEEEHEVVKIKAILAEIKSELKKILELSEKTEERETIEAVQKNLIEYSQTKEKITEKINQANVFLSAKKEKADLLEEKKAQINQELGGINNKLKQHQNQLKSHEVVADRDKLKNDLEKIESEIRVIKEKINSFSAKEEEKRAQLFDLQKNIQSLQNEINQLNNQLNENKINSTRHETRLEDLEGEIREEFGDLKKVKNNRVEGHVDEDLAKEKINNLKKQLNMIGSIDPETEKEYIETKGRFDFLSGQVDDLTKAVESLEKVIKELDMVIKERFDKEFKIISEKFEEYFKILFNGGKAKIIKVLAEQDPSASFPRTELGARAGQDASAALSIDTSAALPAKDETSMDKKGAAKGEEMGAERASAKSIRRIKFLQKHNATGLAGVEIQATPPGKKIASVSMLSGGERALTAIALICAIISANPSPFVVLDEVDAALDEANSERLAKILDDLSHRTQFIIITHNRASMRRANILYGVTMQDDGVSKLLSIKLEEAEKKQKADYK